MSNLLLSSFGKYIFSVYINIFRSTDGAVNSFEYLSKTITYLRVCSTYYRQMF